MKILARISLRSLRRGVGLVAAVATLVIPAVGVPTVAHADASATVKVKTQRMSSATLQSRQDGWYDTETRLNLVCSTRGLALKGFFSPYIPNWRWDNFWYRTSDGHYGSTSTSNPGPCNRSLRTATPPRLPHRSTIG